jgi:WD40 repeat protein
MHRPFVLLLGLTNLAATGCWDPATSGGTPHLRDFDSVPAVGWFEDGERVATSTVGCVQVWDVASLTATVEGEGWGHAKPSPDGELIATSDGEEVVLLDAGTGEGQARFPIFVPDGFTTNSADDLGWSPDGTRIAAVGYQALHVFELAADEAVWERTGPDEGGAALAWAPDGDAIVAGRDTLRIFDLDGGGIDLDTGGEAISSLDWRGDNVAAGFLDGTVRVYAPDGSVRWSDGGPRQIERVALSDDGSRLATADDLGNLRWLDAANGESVGSLSGGRQSVSVDFLADLSRAAVGYCRDWDTECVEGVVGLPARPDP